jgi:hypothetical protein
VSNPAAPRFLNAEFWSRNRFPRLLSSALRHSLLFFSSFIIQNSSWLSPRQSAIASRLARWYKTVDLAVFIETPEVKRASSRRAAPGFCSSAIGFWHPRVAFEEERASGAWHGFGA